MTARGKWKIRIWPTDVSNVSGVGPEGQTYFKSSSLSWAVEGLVELLEILLCLLGFSNVKYFPPMSEIVSAENSLQTGTAIFDYSAFR